MAEKQLKFRHDVIDADPPSCLHDVTLLADVNGNGRTDVIIGSAGEEGVTLFWYENPTWERHDMACTPSLEAGGVAFDITGNGHPDVIVGQQWEKGAHELFWYEQPDGPARLWPRYTIEDRWQKYHDQAVGDVDGDGEPEIVGLSQGGGVLFYYDIPPDPRVSPWPKEYCHLIAQDLGKMIEGLAIVDIDGDGKTEIIAGTNIFRPGPRPGELWQREAFATDFRYARVQVADLDETGRLDIVICEGESNPGRLAICSPPGWEPKLLHAGLFHPHSLELADFDGDGRLDIFVGEMSLGENPDPELMIYRNRGGGDFEETIISRGIGTHEAKVADMTGDGRPDIVGKPYDPKGKIDIWYNET